MFKLRRKLYLFSLLAGLLLIVPLALAQDSITPPKVIETNPLAGEELALDSPVRFVFDRPMEADSVSVEVEPSLDGEGTLTWEGERTLIYTPPTAGYTRDTEY